MATAHDLLQRALSLHQAQDFAQAERLYAQIVLIEPENAQIRFLHGSAAQALGDLDQAIASYRRALRIQPDHAEALLRLGNCLYAQARYPDAEATYRFLVQVRPGSPEARTNLGSALQEQGKRDEAVACHEEALRIQPGFLDATYNLGNALRELGRPAEAVPHYLQALAQRPEFAEAHLNLGMAYLLLGRYEDAWPHYEWRMHSSRVAPRGWQEPRWDGAPLAGRTLLLSIEQGLGDVILAVRFARQLQDAGRIVLECPPRLCRLLAGVDGLDEILPRGSTISGFDVHAPLLSLPGLLGTTFQTIPAPVPYLAAEPDLATRWKQELGALDGFKVGLAWKGDDVYRWDRDRSIPLLQLAALARVEGVRLISLQKGPGAEQLRELEGRFEVLDLGDRLDGDADAFIDTAAAMKSLDLVISADTAVAHLAGALGVPVWLALSKVPHWYWGLEGDRTPWYPTMRLFRQRWSGDWAELFTRMARALQQEVWLRSGQRSVAVATGLGDLIDRITILELKAQRIEDPSRLVHVRAELAALTAARDRVLAPSAALDPLAAGLRAVNALIWDAEDALRACERADDFGARFIELARSIYRNNDHRAALKRTINERFGSSIVEEKSYTSYGA